MPCIRPCCVGSQNDYFSFCSQFIFKPFFIPSFLQILLLHLKRFSFRNFIWRDKITKFVDFPLHGLDLRKYCPSLNNNNNNNGSNNDNNDNNCVYDLYAVINHFGGIMGGHYTAYARLPAESDSAQSELPWRLFDDSHVTTVHRDADVITRNAYVLFYVRRDEKDVAGALAAAAAAAAMATGDGVSRSPSSGDSGEDDDEDDDDFDEAARRGRNVAAAPAAMDAQASFPGFYDNFRGVTAESEASAWRKGSDASTCTEDTLLSSAGTDCDEID